MPCFDQEQYSSGIYSLFIKRIHIRSVLLQRFPGTIHRLSNICSPRTVCYWPQTTPVLLIAMLCTWLMKGLVAPAIVMEPPAVALMPLLNTMVLLPSSVTVRGPVAGDPYGHAGWQQH